MSAPSPFPRRRDPARPALHPFGNRRRSPATPPPGLHCGLAGVGADGAGHSRQGLVQPPVPGGAGWIVQGRGVFQQLFHLATVARGLALVRVNLQGDFA